MKTAFILMVASTVMSAGVAVGMMRYLRGGNGFGARGTGSEVGPDSSNLKPCTSNPEPSLFDANVSRLEREIHALSRRGNLNLTIGVITTGFAVGLLAYMVMNEDAPTGDTAEVLAHYIPRISTVTFIEIFSYFFLRLYRSSLAEIKYYQNELTVLAGQRVALESSIEADFGAVGRILDRIVARDPNAVPGNPPLPLPSMKGGEENVKLALELVERIGSIAAASSKSRSA